MLRVSNAVVVHKPLYMNTVRMGSATHGGLKIDSLADSFMVHDKMYETVVMTYPELKNHSLAFLMDVCLLKYNESITKLASMNEDERKKTMPRLKKMRSYIRRRARQALFDSEIYWKTRVSYLLK